jgi:hypothetical protein
MQAGIFAALAIGKRVSCSKNQQENFLFKPKWTTISTAFGILARVVFMSIILYFALPQSSPIGFSFPLDVTIGYLPFAAIFNASLALYTILIGFLIAGRVQKVLHLTLPNEAKCSTLADKRIKKLEA